MTTIQIGYLIVLGGWIAFATSTLASEAKTPMRRIGWFATGLFAGAPAVALLSIYFSTAA